MEFIKSKINLVALAFVVFTGANCAASPFTMEISTSQAHIKVGEPLLMSLICSYQEPRISEVTKRVSTSVKLEYFCLRMQDANNKTTETYKLMPIYLNLQGSEGLTYKGTFDIFYHESAKLIFDQPGIYNVCLLSPSEKHSSNSLEIVVEPPSEAEEKALSFFAGVEDFIFLMGGLCEKEEKAKRMAKLEEVVNKYGQTTLAKWSAARLGIEYFEEFDRQYYNSKEIEAIRQKKSKGYPLFNKARIYLEKGSALPDGFSIRSEVLDKLMETEYINGNYKKAIQLAEELENKYPYSEYGQKAPRAKKQLRELEESEKGKK